MTMDETMLDGNAAAGDLQELFAVEVTQMVGVCAACGMTGPLAEAHVFALAPGLTVRCPSCDAVLARLVHVPGRTLVELYGLRRLEVLS
jgi:hypothetical protein